MRLTPPLAGGRRRRGLVVGVALAFCLLLVVSADPALAKSSLGIGTAEVTAQPSGPLAGLFVEINRLQREFFTALRQALVSLKNGTGGTLFLIGLSFAYGVFHAAGPGHGKAVISSYMLANEVQLRRGILLSFVSALLQALTAIVVVGAGFLFLRGTAVSMTDATNWLEIASYALIVAFGLWLLAAKVMRLIRLRGTATSGGLGFAPAAPMTSGGGSLIFEVPQMRTVSATSDGSTMLGRRPASPAFAGPIMRPASAALAADVCREADEDCDCGRSHMVDPHDLGASRLSLGSAASAVFAVGLRPCSGAVVVLSFALLNGLVVGGVLSVLAMALGTAITVAAIAAVAVYAKGAALRLGAAGGKRRRVLDGVEILGALLVVALGALLLGGALA